MAAGVKPRNFRIHIQEKNTGRKTKRKDIMIIKESIFSVPVYMCSNSDFIKKRDNKKEKWKSHLRVVMLIKNLGSH